ncbi:hypothetical protein SLEP1_g15763 [Rubroshorea leprosula]|uniref:Amino acid transporter transmembrane domain-containing protein n=1 Tax=Rubroshorea leprosula TaxID=152421 RepID=A0AAV5INK5_9ROSI|nr:hypothetical protein SLEP1_g15763 [Rubroshorea leprosula]
MNYFIGSIPGDICQLSTLVYLDLSSNNFSDIPPSIGGLRNLKELRLQYNEFNATFPGEIGNLSNLELLWMANNGFVRMKIPNRFTQLKKLRNLWMRATNLIGQIPEGFANISSLEWLDLSENNLEGPIPSRLLMLKKLTNLFLYNNELSGEIPRPVEALNLSQIDLCMNNLTGTIPGEFGMMRNLVFFNLMSNQLTGEIPAGIGSLSSLAVLEAGNNLLSGEIPAGIGSLSSLMVFEANNNLLSGQIPAGIGSLSSLIDFEVNNNLLSGQIPAEIGSLSSLAIFEASNNLLSGHIPVEITHLSSLFTLLLDGNQLSGELPSDVASWKSLITLDLSGNKLSGQIPVAIGSLPNLLSLDLSENQFSGKIPASLGNLKLTSLNLSSNKLSEEIPDEFDNLAYENSFLNNSNLCAATGGFLSMRQGFGAASRSAIFGGVLLALIEVAGIMLNKVLSAPQNMPIMMEEPTPKMARMPGIPMGQLLGQSPVPSTPPTPPTSSSSSSSWFGLGGLFGGGKEQETASSGSKTENQIGFSKRQRSRGNRQKDRESAWCARHEARHQVSESGLDINRGPVMEVDDDGKPRRTGGYAPGTPSLRQWLQISDHQREKLLLHGSCQKLLRWNQVQGLWVGAVYLPFWDDRRLYYHSIDKHGLTWLSTVAAVMSFGYAFIGIGLAFAKVVSGKGERTSLTGMEVGVGFNAADNVWTMLRAVGDMAFAFAYSTVLTEIQDTLKSSPPENQTMKKANTIGMSTATTLYLLCSCLGYATFGDHAPGNFLTGFGFYEWFWLLDLANVFIVVHLVGAYQLNRRKLSFSLLRLVWRTLFVVVATVLAMALPFFNDILALLGAIGFWPMTVYFPVEMYIVRKKIKRGSRSWVGLQILNFVCLLVSVAVTCGSLKGLNQALKSSKPFKFKE